MTQSNNQARQAALDAICEVLDEYNVPFGKIREPLMTIQAALLAPEQTDYKIIGIQLDKPAEKDMQIGCVNVLAGMSGRIIADGIDDPYPEQTVTDDDVREAAYIAQKSFNTEDRTRWIAANNVDLGHIFYLTHTEIAAIKTCIRAATKSEWQPIETAPRDKYIIIAGDSGYSNTPLRVSVCKYDAEWNIPWRDHAGDAFQEGGSWPTHWMPLPGKPLDAQKNGGG